MLQRIRTIAARLHASSSFQKCGGGKEFAYTLLVIDEVIEGEDKGERQAHQTQRRGCADRSASLPCKAIFVGPEVLRRSEGWECEHEQKGCGGHDGYFYLIRFNISEVSVNNFLKPSSSMRCGRL